MSLASLKVLMAPRVSREWLERTVKSVKSVFVVLLAPLDPPASLEKLDYVDTPVRRVVMDPLVPAETSVNVGPRENPAKKVYPVLTVSLASRVHQDHQEPL